MLSALARIPLIRQVGLNTTWLALARIASQAQLAVFTLLVARRLGEAGFGQYSWIASVVLLANVFTTFGTDTLLIRQIARERSARGAPSGTISVLVLQLGLSALLVGGIWAWTGLDQGLAPETALGLRLYSLALLPLAFTSVLTAILRGWERMDLYLLAGLLAGSVQLAGAWAALRSPHAAGLLPLVGWLLAAQVAGALIAGGLCLAAGARLPVAGSLPGAQPRKGGGIQLAGDLAGMLRLALPLALVSLLGLAAQRAGILVLSAQAGDAAAGWYAAGAKGVELARLGHIALLGALLPALSRRSDPVGRGIEPGRLFRAAFILLLGIAVPAALVLTLLARPLVELFFGPGYAPAAAVLRVLAWSLVPYTVSACVSLRWITLGREKKVLAGTALGLGVTLSALYLLVPAYGPLGAAWAALAGETALAAFYGLGILWKRN